MFYRALTVGIVAFWLLMMGLLLRVELASGEGELLSVPPDYVWKLMFLREQPSDLVLYSQHQRIGSFHLQPRRLPTGTTGAPGPVRVLNGSGSLTLNLPGLSGQNLTVRGSLEMDERNTARHVGFNVNLHTPGQIHSRHDVDARWPTVARRMALSGPPGRRCFCRKTPARPPALLGAMNVGSWGIDPQAQSCKPNSRNPPLPKTTARRGVLHTDSEDVEAFRGDHPPRRNAGNDGVRQPTRTNPGDQDLRRVRSLR